jgi:uncharacterized membrane protein YedE/YeeE
MNKLKFLGLGFIFGFTLVKSEAVSWYRIMEMFHFQSFHMFGIIGSAVVVGIISVWLIKKYQLKAVNGEEVRLVGKGMTKGTIIGGLMFGFGWAMTGACPGPLYVLSGSGYLIVVVAFASAVLGTYIYGVYQEKLPQ